MKGCSSAYPPGANRVWIRLVAGVVCLAVGAAGPARGADGGEDIRLEKLLVRLSRMASLYRDTALRWACEETFVWSGMGIEPGHARFDYVFVYDEQNGFHDYRTPAGEGLTGGTPREISLSEYHIPRYLRSAYLWIFAFRRSRQPLHHYELVGEKTVLGRRAVGIRIEPIPPYRPRVNDWYGTAWVDPETAQILRVVAYYYNEYAKKLRFEAYLAGGPKEKARYVYETITTDFTVEKNGLRFPGLVEIDISRYWIRGNRSSGKYRRVNEVLVKQKYRDYKFFGVKSIDEVQHILDGEVPP